jgi:hypothetical protein
MSRTLKRPMFRKGGEVMEGIMTGIKPRESFAEKGMSDDLRGDLGRIQQRVNLIDAVSGAGASPLSNPLTQFLLQTGANLIGGTAAGGTKLQEIVGATKEPLSKAITAQERRDASRRKLTASLIGKLGTGDFSQAFRSYGQYLTNPKTGKRYTKDEFRVVYGMGKISRKPRSAADQAQANEDAYVKNILSKKDFRDNSIYNISEAKKMYRAEEKVRNAENTLIDVSNFHIPKKAELEPTGQKTKAGKSVVKAPPGIKFIDEYVYYDVQGPGTYYRFDEARNILIPLGE